MYLGYFCLLGAYFDFDLNQSSVFEKIICKKFSMKLQLKIKMNTLFLSWTAEVVWNDVNSRNPVEL